MRRVVASVYNELFAAAECCAVLPYQPDWSKGTYHLYVIRVPNRDYLMEQLGAAGIGTGIHYPVPLHLQDAYKNLGYEEGDFPITERVCKEIISLPMFPQLAAEQQSRVVSEMTSLAVMAKQ